MIKTINKRKCIFLITILIITLAMIGTVTYAWLTDTSEANEIIHLTINNAEIDGNIEMQVSATGDTIYGMDTNIDIDDLAYIDLTKDFVSNQYGLLNNMASEIKIKINSTSNVETKAYIKIPNQLVTGLIYFVVLDTDLTGSNTYADLVSEFISDNNFTTSTNRTTIITALNSYNTNKLADLYENQTLAAYNNTADEVNFTLVVWGDYYGLSVSDQAHNVHLNKTFNMSISAYLMQTRSGGSDYENDLPA